MRTKGLVLAVAVSACAAADGLWAQNAGGPCPGMYPSPKVGEYAALKFNSPDQGSMPVRFAVVGTQEAVGRTFYWIEMMSVPPAVGDTVTVQLLVPYYPFEQRELRGYIFKMPGQVAIRIPDTMIPQLREQTPGTGWREQCQTAEDLGNERINVPAGAFIARHYRSQDGEHSVWLADVPFGIVKMVTPSGDMELTAYGDDARSLITEEPVEYQPPPGG